MYLPKGSVARPARIVANAIGITYVYQFHSLSLLQIMKPALFRVYSVYPRSIPGKCII